MKSVLKLIAKLLAIATLLGAGYAMAQSEPSMSQIYATAESGKLAEAQMMVQQVLVSHPKSAKAYFVQAELYARQGQADRARESLSTAEKYAPGLSFAKPEAVQALRAQVAARSVARPLSGQSNGYTAAAAPKPSSTSWAVPLLVTAGVMVGAYFLLRRRIPAPNVQPPLYANPNGMNGPASFGTGANAMQQPGYPQAGYPPQPAGSGLGGRIMGGVATGLAVGAGVMAAEAIGRNLMGGQNNAAAQADRVGASNDFEPIATNTDMGGANFGISDPSWDDGGSMDVGGGSDWDN